MNRLDFLTKSYALLHNYPGLPFWVLTPFRRIVRACANRWLPSYLAKASPSMGDKQSEVIISFTSFPARIENVWQVVECMFRQTVQPAKILLWLSKQQFPTRDSIPMSLRERENDIFEISMVDGDIRSHKKYYYVSKEYPDSLVFLIDDDIYYPTDIIERSLKTKINNPNSVICNFGFYINYYDDGMPKPYDFWTAANGYSDSDDIFFGTGGGTLFCPSELHNDLTDIERALQLTPIADDIWLNAMVRLAKRKIIMVGNEMLLPIINKNNMKLSSQNVGECQNDKQLDAMMEVYVDVFRAGKKRGNERGMN